MIKINYGIILKVASVVVFCFSLIMLVPVFVSWGSGGSLNIPLSTILLATIGAGIAVFFATKNVKTKLGKREGYLIVVVSWLLAGLIGSFPYLLLGESTFIDSLFESVSGLTTTGATMFNDIEELPKSILIWRSLTQWIGGMGIIVLTVAIFPLLGVGGVELFVAESPGPTSNKIHPRIKETAKRLWLLYIGLSIVLIIILKLEGMLWFDAVNHGLTTIATGGFSTKNSSIAYFDSPVIDYTILIFMFIAGINYSLIYAGIKGRFSKFWASGEFKAYLSFVIVSIGITSLFILLNTDLRLEQSFRNAAFQVISIITTTGYITADYTSWHPSITMFFFCLLFAGACAGSTSGGIKFVRHLVFAKNSMLEFKRLLHPNGLIRLRIDNNIVRPKILTHVLVFLMIYLFIFLLGTMVMTFIMSDFNDPLISAAGAVATSLGNVGPGIGDLGPLDTFQNIPPSGKLVLSLIMLLGRLELFSVLIIFTPSFWRVN